MAKKHKDPPACAVPTCGDLGWKWIEEPTARRKTLYLCAEHAELWAAVGQILCRVAGKEYPNGQYAMNSTGEVVEVAEYACSDDCPTCWQ